MDAHTDIFCGATICVDPERSWYFALRMSALQWKAGRSNVALFLPPISLLLLRNNSLFLHQGISKERCAPCLPAWRLRGARKPNNEIPC